MFCCTFIVGTSPEAWRSSGTMAMPRAIRSRTSSARELAAVEPHAAARVRVHAEQGLHQLGAARAHEAVEAENLPGANVEGHVAKTGSARRGRQLQILDGENRCARRARSVRRGARERRAPVIRRTIHGTSTSARGA